MPVTGPFLYWFGKNERCPYIGLLEFFRRESGKGKNGIPWWNFGGIRLKGELGHVIWAIQDIGEEVWKHDLALILLRKIEIGPPPGTKPFNRFPRGR